MSGLLYFRRTKRVKTMTTPESAEQAGAPGQRQHHPQQRQHREHSAPRPPVADDLVNSFRITGSVEDVDMRAKSGALMLIIRTSSVPDRPINGAPVPSWFTPVMPVRVPPDLAARLPRTMLRKNRSIVTIEGRVQGIRRRFPVENEPGVERDFWFVEIVAKDVRLLFSQGRVFGRERADDHHGEPDQNAHSDGAAHE